MDYIHKKLQSKKKIPSSKHNYGTSCVTTFQLINPNAEMGNLSGTSGTAAPSVWELLLKMENNEGEEEMKLWSGRSTDHRPGSGTECSCREAEALLFEPFLQCATTCLRDHLPHTRSQPLPN